MEKKLRESVGSKKVLSRVDESNKFMVAYFASKYHFNKYNAVGELYGTFEYNYEFDDYYVLTLADIYAALFYKIPRQAILDWYINSVEGGKKKYTLLNYFNLFYK